LSFRKNRFSHKPARFDFVIPNRREAPVRNLLSALPQSKDPCIHPRIEAAARRSPDDAITLQPGLKNRQLNTDH